MSQALKQAQKKALAWFRKDNLVTEPEALNYQFPEAMVEIGTIVALEYASDKFDGIERVYRHDVTQERKMYLSCDGTCILILPGFKVTTRGIEG